MKFHITSVRLWFNKDVPPRVLTFLPNKINVITGEKSKGKSSVLSIIDYCLLSTDSRIVEEIINENVEWYGITLRINDFDYVVVRRKPIGHFGSKDIYFSSVGEIPQAPAANIDINKLKSIIEHEFGIDEDLIVPYGGKKIRVGSKVSFRYFLLFNTLSEDIITNQNIFFDFDLYDREKYKEALDRIFFMAMGVDDVGTVLIKEQINNLQAELDKIEKKKKILDKEENLFNQNIIGLLSQAQQYDLVPRVLYTHEEAYEQLKKLIANYNGNTYQSSLRQMDSLAAEKRLLQKRIRNLERFNEEYEEYRKSLKDDEDSLLPIDYIRQNMDEIIPTTEVGTFLSTLKTALQDIKAALADRKSIAVNTKSDVKQLKTELALVERKLRLLPDKIKEFSSESQKLMFVGELKAKLQFFEDKWHILDELPKEQDIIDQIDLLQKQLQDNSDMRKVVLVLLEETIQKYYDRTISMGVYEAYRVFLDVTKKTLRLRKPDDMLPRNTIGSKSNHLFLHLCLFLGLHDYLLRKYPKHVAQFLVMDQITQPYLEKTEKETAETTADDDRKTIQDAFRLLNTFMDAVTGAYGNEFQIILLEHASRDHWEETNLSFFHVVEEFRGDNGLIPAYAK